MKILSEKNIKMVKLDIELEDNEESMLLEYASKNMPKDILKWDKIEWAITDIIVRSVNEDKEKRRVGDETKNTKKRLDRNLKRSRNI